MENEKNKSEIHIGCGCLTDIIAVILFIIVCDLIGCDFAKGFTDKLNNAVRGAPVEQVQER